MAHFDGWSLAAASVNQMPLDFDGNVQRLLNASISAHHEGVELLVCPELSISGYGCEDHFYHQKTLQDSWNALEKLAESCPRMTLIVGAPILHKDLIYNCAIVIHNNRIVGIHPKKALANRGVHYESRWFTPWTAGKFTLYSPQSKNHHKRHQLYPSRGIPFGDFCYKLVQSKASWLHFAIEICEEAWVSHTSLLRFRDQFDLVLNPSASHFALGKQTERERLLRRLSKNYHSYYLYANLVGLEAGRLLYDGSNLVASRGRILKKSPRFGFDELSLLCTQLSEAELLKIRSKKALRSPANLSKRNKNAHLKVITLASKKGISQAAGDKKISQHSKREKTSLGLVIGPDCSPFEEFLFAETLALFDYLRKSRSKGFVVSLSGGCDSAACAVLIRQMIEMAYRQLGSEKVRQLLDCALPKSFTVDEPAILAGQLLTCAYLASENSSELTQQAAKKLALELNARFVDFDITSLVNGFTQEFTAKTDLHLNWNDDDLTLQNIQARTRAPLVWLLANKLNALLITTSNRSESAVGYATMDGDMAGCLAPLAGVQKSFLRGFLHWQENECTHGVGKISALRLINQQVPTAELRPLSAKQSDEDDLMPYAVLDLIEHEMIGLRQPIDKVILELRKKFPNYHQNDIRQWVKKFQVLWKRSQWKRERCAPSFHMDNMSEDPKYWARFPIFQG